MRVAASITGAIWYVNGKGDVLKNVIITVDTKEELLVTEFSIDKGVIALR